VGIDQLALMSNKLDNQNNQAKPKPEKGLMMPIKYLKGVGEVRSRWLANLGINSVWDLMRFFPHHYIRRGVNAAIYELEPGMNVAMTVMISWMDVRLTARNQKQLNVGVSDGKSCITCTWFNYPPAYEKTFRQGQTLWINGTVTEYNGQLQIIHPEIEVISDEQIEDDFWKQRSVLPVYHLSGNLTQNFFRRIIYQVFETFTGLIEESLPQFILNKYHFPDIRKALQIMHFTTHPEQVDRIRMRFVYEEFLYIQLLWARHKHFHQSETHGIRMENKRLYTRQLYDKLPFTLTAAQKRVLREIFDDMLSPLQMSRLLQGDVGSGKTIVTLFAMLLAVENGYQAALMTPTEILAEQHYRNINDLLQNININVCLIKGGVYKGKAQFKAMIESGEAQIIIGTHALIQETITYHKLGFIAVDEQHRFGVEQRAVLSRKGLHPDMLYLSATPIPRSLSMTVYGDLEVSIIDELPPNRKPVTTLIRSSAKIDLVYSLVRKELVAGRQVYIVCPLIEESEKVDLLDAQRLYEHISRKSFPDIPSALLHGKMKSRDKDAIMQDFKDKKISILVSTTVIEVGVDVPNATVMIVEHAERFGLAQLHQLRGRVGRGAAQSYCFLIEHFPVSAIGRERLTTISGTNDGFAIAEKDLELRGPGEFFGTDQSGLPRFRFANLARDTEILKLARIDAFEIINHDPDLCNEEHSLLKRIFSGQFAQREELFRY